jgi:hypothetical protein
MYPAPDENNIGRGWERPVSVEYFNTDGTASFQINGGIEIHGGESRRPEKSPKHSFRLNFKSEYGASKLEYPLFDGSSATNFNSLVLRAGYNHSWTHSTSAQRLNTQYIRDTWLKDTQRRMGHISSNSVYVHLYINGLYWGIYEPSERLDSKFAASYLGGSDEDFDVIKDYQEVVDGDINAWNNLITLANAGLETTEAYQHIQGNLPDGTPNPNAESYVDVTNLADYMLLNFYVGNMDWDHHNWAAIRNRVEPGSGFKFMIWDAENIMASLSDNVTNKNNYNCPSNIFFKLRQNDDFKRFFADRVHKYCFNNGLLTPLSVQNSWLERSNQVEPAIPAESARWGDYRRDVHPYQAGPYELYTYENHWLSAQNFLFNTYMPQRTDIFIQQLKSLGLYPALDAPEFRINNQLPNDNIVSAGDQLTMTSTEGNIYYTTNGDDPALRATQDPTPETVLIAMDHTKKVFVPKSDIGISWLTDKNYGNGVWQVCSGAPGGIGYEKQSGYQDYITLDVSADMYTGGSNPNTSCYIQISFTVTAQQLENLKSLVLYMYYDDGFVAYLNGTKITSANAPTTPVWNSAATTQYDAGDTPNAFNISEFIHLLTEGENLLAIQGMNNNTNSSDFLINASLVGKDNVSDGASSEANIYTEPIVLTQSTHILARTFLNGNWSALNEKHFIVPENYQQIKITEVHYHPKDNGLIDGDNYEFIEIKNTGSATLDIGGLTFSDGISYSFPPETKMNPGEFIVLCANANHFATQNGFEAFDVYDGNLSNSGELIVLVNPFGETICSFFYSDNAPWPISADGVGFSMVALDPNPTGNLQTASQWRASILEGGSPGRDDTDSNTAAPQQPATGMNHLYQNHPNPFSDVTNIDYSISEGSFVEISVYSIAGQKIETLVNEYKEEGTYTIQWYTDNSAYENGIYFYRITTRNQNNFWQESRKMVMLKK